MKSQVTVSIPLTRQEMEAVVKEVRMSLDYAPNHDVNDATLQRVVETMQSALDDENLWGDNETQ